MGALRGRLTLTERHEPVTTRREWHSHIKPHNGYRSKFEAEVAAQLVRAGVKFSYETGRIRYSNAANPCGVYIPDFTIFRLDGSTFYIEAKGWIDQRAHNKLSAVRLQHPELDLRFVFQCGTTKVARLKSNVCQWAKRKRWLWSVRDVPTEWLTEATPDQATT